MNYETLTFPEHIIECTNLVGWGLVWQFYSGTKKCQLICFNKIKKRQTNLIPKMNEFDAKRFPPPNLNQLDTLVGITGS